MATSHVHAGRRARKSCRLVMAFVVVSSLLVSGCSGRIAGGGGGSLRAAVKVATKEDAGNSRRRLLPAFTGINGNMFNFNLGRVSTAAITSQKSSTTRTARRSLLSMMSNSEEEEEERLRKEMDQLLKGTGRDTGMKQLKPRKGMRESIQVPKPKSSAAAAPPAAAPPAARPPGAAQTPADSEEGLTMEDLLNPKPKAASPPVARPPSGPAPELVKPSYTTGRGSNDDVFLLGLTKGDSVPSGGDAWGGLVNSEGEPVHLGDYSGKLLLLVPEPAHHTGAVTDSWTKILNELRDVLGSKRGDVSILGISPEPMELHAKLRKRENYKFELASDSDRRLVSSLKLWNPSGRVATDRQTLLVDPDTGKVVHVWRNVQATGHALQVREVLDQLAEDKEEGGGGGQGAKLSAPPPRPAVVEPEAATPPPAGEAKVSAPKTPPPAREAKVSAPPVKPVAKPPSASAPPPAAPAAKAVENVEDAKEEEEVVEVKPPPLRPSSVAQDAAPAASGQEPHAESASGPVAKSTSQIEEVKEVHPIEASMVGTLIGRGGARVKELSKLSGAFIKFEVDPPSMIIGGTDEQRELALKIATEWIDDIGEESMELEGFVTGLLIGPKGKTIREIESKSGAVLRFEKNPEVMIVRGTSQERKDAMDMAREVIKTSAVAEMMESFAEDVDVGSVRMLLRNGGAGVKEVEEVTGARVRFDLDKMTFTIKGTAESRKAAAEMVLAKVLEANGSEMFLVAECEHYRLIGPGGKVVRGLEDDSGARISFNSVPEPHMLVRGSKEQIAKAWELASEMLTMEGSDEYPVKVEDARYIIGPGGKTVKQIEKESGARITLTRDGDSRIIVRGVKEARDKAWEMVQYVLESPECVASAEVDAYAVELLLSDRAAVLTRVESESCCCISVQRVGGGRDGEVMLTDDGKVLVTARALPDSLATFETILLKAIEEEGERVGIRKSAAGSVKRVFTLSEIVPEGSSSPSILDVRRLVGPKGSTVRRLEEESKCQIIFSFVPEPMITMVGNDETIPAAIRLIQEEIELTRQLEERYPMEQRFHGTLIGVGGRAVQRIEEESGSKITFQSTPESVMIVRGTPDQRKAAYDLAMEMLEEDTVEVVYADPQYYSGIIGQKGQNVREIERESGARVQVPTDGNAADVVKLGLDMDTFVAEKQGRVAVVMKGTASQRETAKALLFELIRNQEVEAFPLVKDSSGVVLWQSTANLNAIEGKTGVKIRVERGENPRVLIRGPEEARKEAWAMLQEASVEDGEEVHEIGDVGQKSLLTVRLLIGPSGQSVKELEKVSGARVKFQSLNGKSLISIRGNKQQRETAYSMVQEQLGSYEEERFPLGEAKHYIVIGVGGETVRSIEVQSGAAIAFEKRPLPSMVAMGTAEQRTKAFELAQEVILAQGELEQEKFAVERKFHALLIGATGRRVQELERKTGAHIQFESQPEEVMLVTGTPEQRSAAWQLVQELISAEEEERVPVPASQHRSIIGARGVSISHIERESGAHISFEVEPAEAMVVRGTTAQRKLAIELVSDVLAGEEEEQFYVEHRYHGYLIGPGGSRVREIEQATVTRVSCNDEEPVVVVYGSSKRRDAAWEMIKAKMDEYDEDRSSGATGA